MRLATREQAVSIDAKSQKLGFSQEILMEAAGVTSAKEIELGYFPELKRGVVHVVCGPGNNGADALVVARHLASAKYPVKAILVGASKASIYQLQVQRAERSGVKIEVLSENAKTREIAGYFSKDCALIVDGIFGIGLSREVSGVFEKTIECMNLAKVPVVSIDVPSGLDVDRGVPLGVAVKAAMTLTFGISKRGFYISEGPKLCGRVRVLPIGFPVDVVRSIASTCYALDSNSIRKLLPVRKNSSNKSTHGRAVLFAGSKAYPGAAILASVSAARVGAGYVTLSTNGDPKEFIASFPEFLFVKSDDDVKLWESVRKSAVAVGPGLGSGDSTRKLIQRLVKMKIQNVVLDADALTVLAKDPMKLPRSWILTPHAGEMARLLNADPKNLERDRFGAAEMAAHRFGCTVLFKGYRTVVSDGEKSLVVLSGNASLAKAGTGDVLTGMIVGLMAQGLKPVVAAAVAAYIHGKAADEWLKSGRDKLSLLPSDVRDIVPSLLKRIREGSL